MDERQRRLAGHIIDGLNLEEITVDDIDPEAPLFGGGLGLDSIDALELSVVVERNYGVTIADMEEGRDAFASLAALDAWIAAHQG